MYEPLDALCLRAPTLPIVPSQAPPATGGLTLDPPNAFQRYALTIASPSLAAALDRTAGSGGSADADDVRGKWLRYGIRMRARPTPFGLFAGVMLARWGPETDLTLTGIKRVRIRPDMEWLATLVRKLEKRDVIRNRLRWISNPAAFVSGGRAYLEEGTPDGRGAISIRATPAVLRALAAARAPVTYARLVAQLASEEQREPHHDVEQLLEHLWEQGFLHTELMPSLSTADPLGHVLSKLRANIQAKAICLRLDALAAAIGRCEAAPPNKALELHRYAAAQASLITNAGPSTPLQVDCSLSSSGQSIHRGVARRAALAAETLLRLSGAPTGPAKIGQYRQAFLARYGTYRQVPLLELVSPDWGLGPLSAMTETGQAPTEARFRRAGALQELALRAVRDRELRVVLDKRMLERLEHPQFTADRAPHSLDLHIFVIAEDARSIDRGRFLVAIAPSVGALNAGRFVGRFAHVIGGDMDAMLRAVVEREQALSNTKSVDLAYLPSKPRAANVAICQTTGDYQSTFGAMARSDQCVEVPLDEILVSVRDDRFLLRWPRGECFVRFSARHLVNPLLAPEVVQFLLDASQDGITQLGPFDWGACANQPVLPRLEFNGVVLCPARWRLKAPAAGMAKSESDVERYVKDWRSQWDVPRQVYLAAGDNRLLLDLADPAQFGELVRDVRTLQPNSACLVEEALPGADHAWIKGADGAYIADLVVSLVRRQTTVPPRPVVPPRDFAVPPRNQRIKTPGTDWAYLKLYIPSGAQDEVLRGPFLDLQNAMMKQPIEKWFFVRYADPDVHLRLRFSGPEAWLNREWLPQAMDWSRSLVERGLCDRIAVDTYEREIERYGGLASIDACETLFHLDSHSVVGMLRQIADERSGADTTELAMASVDDFYDALAPDAETAVRWLTRAAGLRRKVVGTEYRQIGTRLQTSVADRTLSSARLASLLEERRVKIRHLCATIRALDAAAPLCVSMEELCASLAHMHLNRLLPVGKFDEGRLFGLLARTREVLLHARRDDQQRMESNTV